MIRSEYTDNDLIILARTIYGEARGEGRDGMIAVGCCIINRFKSGRWFAGETLADTCLKPYQFSCWLKNDPNYNTIKTLKKEWLGECYNVALLLLLGNCEDITKGATHYHTRQVKPNWSENQQSHFALGNHLFYKGIN